jgi:hypothetical protein
MVTLISGCLIITALRAKSAVSQNARMLRDETSEEHKDVILENKTS